MLTVLPAALLLGLNPALPASLGVAIYCLVRTCTYVHRSLLLVL